MPTPFGTLTPEELANGWTAETLARYHAEREDAAGFHNRAAGTISHRVAQNTVTEYVRPQPPVRMESAMQFKPHQWGRK